MHVSATVYRAHVRFAHARVYVCGFSRVCLSVYTHACLYHLIAHELNCRFAKGAALALQLVQHSGLCIAVAQTSMFASPVHLQETLEAAAKSANVLVSIVNLHTSESEHDPHWALMLCSDAPDSASAPVT